MTTESYDYWVDKLHKLGYHRFEELCMSILKTYGYKTNWLQGSYDNGRDIEAINNNKYSAYDCKCYDKGVPKEKLMNFVSWVMSKPKYTELYILSNSYLSTGAQDFLDNMNTNSPALKDRPIKHITESNFQDWLFNSPGIYNLMMEYFSNEEIPPMYKQVKYVFRIEIKNGLINPDEFNNLSELEKLKHLFEILIEHKMDNIDKAKIYQKMTMMSIIYGDLEFANRCVKEGLKIVNNRDLLLYSGYILVRQEDWRKALDEYKKIISTIDEYDAIALFNKAVCLNKLRQIKPAKMVYEILDREHPNFILSSQHKLDVKLDDLMKKGDFSKTAEFEEYIKDINSYFKDIDDGSYNFNLAKLYLGIKDYANAIKYIDFAINIHPYSSDLYNYKGVILEHYSSEFNLEDSISEKSKNIALNTFKKAYEFNPFSNTIIGNIIRCESNVDEINKFLENIPEYIKEDPEIKQRLLEHQFMLGDNPNEEIFKLFKKYPHMYRIRQIYVKSLIEIGHFSEANSELNKLLKENNIDWKLWLLKLRIIEQNPNINSQTEIGKCKEKLEKYNFPRNSDIPLDYFN